MRTIIRWRWLVLALWAAAAALLLATAPNMEQLVRDKGQIDVPDGYSSSVASGLLRDMSAGKTDGGGLSTVLVFHREGGLSEDDMENIRQSIAGLSAGGERYGITSVISHFDNPELEKQTVSADGSTVLALVGLDVGDRTLVEAKDDLYEATAQVGVDHYFTGGWLISEDVIQSSQEGLKKTELITVGFILAILILVFRSAAAPFIPLLVVGISYLVSQSVVAYLVQYADFPLSTFTQIFMVAVLFGIGTDYCILLISRFKEELAHAADTSAAVVATYRASGKTVLFSGLAVLVGFTSIGFSTFALYRSAVAVAVGVAVLLLALVTLVPFFLATFGKATFWPVRGSLEHKPSRLWGAVGSFSLKRPLWALAMLAAATVPFLVAYQGTPSFNSLDEIGDKYDSVKAFHIIADGFGPGDSLPTTVVMKADRPFDSQEGLAAVEQVSRELAALDGVKTVRSATRPAGEAIADLQVASQAQSLGDGLGQAGEGIGEIGDGLSEASSALSGNAPQLESAVAGAEQLTAGTNALKDGIAQLGDGLAAIEGGLRDGSVGLTELRNGLQQAQSSASELAAASETLLTGYEEAGEGVARLADAYEQLASQQAALTLGLAGIGDGLDDLASRFPDLRQDAGFLQLLGAASELEQGSLQLGSGLEQLNAQLAGAGEGLSQANAGFARAAEGQAALAGGLSKLAQGIAELQSGIVRAADGQREIVGRIPGIASGFDRVSDGQRELADGLSTLGSQLAELTDGLDRSVEGLAQVSEGLQSARQYAVGLSEAPDARLAGWYMPNEAAEDAEFQEALDVYMSLDRTIAAFHVVFEGNPYEVSTLMRIESLEEAVDRAVKGTSFASSAVAVDGVSSINNDLRNISAEDYSRTVVLMLVGIFLILVVLFRSLVMPVYLVLSLLLTYYTSMAIAELIFVRWIGLSGISWAVPFFGFVMLMALGIDYSIFLMDRFKEYRNLPPREGILRAMRNMGTVIISAAIILGGTFAAMLPSGVMSLMQIATIVLCGLSLYALVMLPLFIPVMVRTFGEANWWPFMSRGESPSGSAAGHTFDK